MTEEISISFLINNGVAVVVAWYVLTRLNVTLKDLTTAINNLGTSLTTRMNQLERRMEDHGIAINKLERLVSHDERR